MTASDIPRLIGIVGPCGAGKSTLALNLIQRGFNARQTVQEHSYVPDMWRRLTNPDILIFLDASYEITKRRRQLDWTPADYTEQHHRLRHARHYADLYLFTDEMTPQEVLDKVLEFLNRPH